MRPYVAFPALPESIASARTQMELIRGSFIVGRAIESENLGQLPELTEMTGKEDLVVWIQQRLKAVRIGESELYEVSFTARNPESAQKVLSAIVASYLSFYVEEGNSQREQMLDNLREEQLLRDREILAKRDHLRELEGQDRIEKTALHYVRADDGRITKTAARTAFISSLQRKLAETEIENEISRARVAALREVRDEPVEVYDRELHVKLMQDAEIIQLTRDFETALKNAQAVGADDPESTRVAQDAFQAADIKLETRTGRLLEKLRKEAEEQIARERRQALTAAETQLKISEKSVDLLGTRLEAERQRTVDHPDRSLEIEFARSELDSAHDVRRRIANRALALMVESRAPGQVQLIQDAKLPALPEEPPPLKRIPVAGALAFIAPFLVYAPCLLVAALWRRYWQPT